MVPLDTGKLEWIMRTRFWSGRALAKKIGITPTSFYRIASGKTQPKPSTLKKLCETLECGPEELLADSTTKRTDGGTSPMLDREKLVAIMERDGLTGAELARRAGIGRTTVYRLAKGTQQPTPETLERLADALHVNPQALLIERGNQ